MKVDHDGVRLSDGHQMVPFAHNPSTEQQTLEEMKANALKYSMNVQPPRMFSPSQYMSTEPSVYDMEYFKHNALFNQSFLQQMVSLLGFEIFGKGK